MAILRAALGGLVLAALITGLGVLAAAAALAGAVAAAAWMLVS